MMCNTLLNCWALFLAVIGIGEHVRLQGLVERSAGIATGASEAEVERLLGEPNYKWKAKSGLGRLILGDRPTRWIYATGIDLQSLIVPGLPFPNPFPLNIRWFQTPDDSDLVVEWTPNNQVAKVTRPVLYVPPALREFYERLFSMADAARNFAAKAH